MKCVYINLEKDVKKRESIEKNIRSSINDQWVIERFQAIDKRFVAENNVRGAISDGAKGCFLSHRSIINKNVEIGSHLFMLEDDAVFCDRTQNFINQAISAINSDWDMLYTDICVPQASTMIDLFQLKRQCSIDSQLRILNLKNFNFASTVAYIINRNSIKKVAELLNKFENLDVPIDLYYRHLVHSGQINAFVTFPFLTSLSDLSGETNIQHSEANFTEMIWQSFRKFIWINGSVQSICEDLKKIKKSNLNNDAQACLTLVSGLLSDDFFHK